MAADSTTNVLKGGATVVRIAILRLSSICLAIQRWPSKQDRGEIVAQGKIARWRAASRHGVEKTLAPQSQAQSDRSL